MNFENFTLVLNNKNIYQLKVFFCIVLILKILILSLFFLGNSNYSFGGGNDADYYDKYARAIITEKEYKLFWGEFLKLLNENGFYSRGFVSGFLLLLNTIVNPLLACMVVQRDFGIKKINITMLFTFMSMNLYPTLVYYSLDIYRESFMVFIFLLFLIAIKEIINDKNNMKNKLFWILGAVFFLYLLAELRLYLFSALIIALLLSPLIKNFIDLILLIILGFFAIQIIYHLGLFDGLISYRRLFLSVTSGTGLNIDLNEGIFLLKFLQSFMIQLFGIKFSDIKEIVVFCIETIPLIIGIIFLIKNKSVWDRFIIFLIIFSLIYTSIWSIGNDNLGTAIRLRVFAYLAVVICVGKLINIKLNNLLDK